MHQALYSAAALSAFSTAAYGLLSSPLDALWQRWLFEACCALTATSLISGICKHLKLSWAACWLWTMVVGGSVMIGTIAYIFITLEPGDPSYNRPIGESAADMVSMAGGFTFLIGIVWMFFWIFYSMATAEIDHSCQPINRM